MMLSIAINGFDITQRLRDVGPAPAEDLVREVWSKSGPSTPAEVWARRRKIINDALDSVRSLQEGVDSMFIRGRVTYFCVDPLPVSIGQFGRDHWSTFHYLATCQTSNKDVDFQRMRACHFRHPQFAVNGTGGGMYPTIARGFFLFGHDEWDCVEDMVRAGLVTWEGTGIHPRIRMTEQGWIVLQKLTEHKNAGKSYAEFTVENLA